MFDADRWMKSHHFNVKLQRLQFLSNYDKSTGTVVSTLILLREVTRRYSIPQSCVLGLLEGFPFTSNLYKRYF